MRRVFCSAVFLIVLRALSIEAQVNVWTYHNDNGRTGLNASETILTPANVTNTLFGKIFFQSANGYVYTQPLYVGNLAIAGKGTHNVVFVATQHDSVYAFDADNNSGSNSAPLWKIDYVNPAAGITTLSTTDVGTSDITPEIGITGTPVIDLASNTLFVVAKTKEIFGVTTNFVQRLHAIDITTGLDRTNVVIQASVPGTGQGNDGNGNVPFNALRENQRCALALSGGIVYVAYASHGDNQPYHGWILGYDARTLARVEIFNATPNGGLGGIWEAGGAPSFDSSGNLFCITGNGTFNTNNANFGDSFLKLSTGSSLTVVDNFTPFNQATLDASDIDLGSGGALVLPDSVGSVAHPHLVVGAGKQGKVYLIDRDNMGHFNSTNDNQIVQSFTGLSSGCFDSPAFFNGRIYVFAKSDVIKAFQITNGLIVTNPVTKGTLTSSFPGAQISISANGTNNGIAWAIQTSGYTSNGPSVLRAYNATNLTAELYNSSQAGSRDVPGGAVKFSVPTVVNGKVYVGTATGLAVYGLFTSPPVIQTQPLSQTVLQNSNVTFSVGAIGSGTLNYQWAFDGATISGATTTNLVLTNIQLQAAGNYTVIVTNSGGIVTSAVANLSVIAPLKNNPGASPAPPNLINWWPAEGNANDIFDSGNGTPHDRLVYSVGEVSFAFGFNGVDSYIATGLSNVPPPWTASFWVRRQSSPDVSAVLLGDTNYAIKLEQVGTSRKVGISHFNVSDVAFNYAAPSGVWVNLALVATNGQTFLYVNGVLQDTLASTIPLPRAFIGAGFSSGTGQMFNFMAGGADEILLFNRALSSSEISTIAIAASTGLCRAPEFTQIARAGNQVTLGLKGQPGKLFDVFGSSNFSTWVSLGEASNANGTIHFTNTSPAAFQFYQANQP